MVTARTPVWSLSAPRLLSPAPGDTCEVAQVQGGAGVAGRGALVATAGERRYCTPALGGSGRFRHLPTGHRGAPGRGTCQRSGFKSSSAKGRKQPQDCLPLLPHSHPPQPCCLPAHRGRTAHAPHPTPTPRYPCRPLPLLASWSLLTCRLLRGDHPDHCIFNSSLFALH